MESPVNIKMALGTDIIGMVLVVVMIIGNIWRLRLKNRVSKLLIAMLATCFSCCLSDLLSFAFDGNKGLYAREIVHFANTWLYASIFCCAYSWFVFMKEYFHVELSPAQQWGARLPKIALPILLIANIKWPIIFSVNEYNLYSREFGYWIYVALNYSIIINSLFIYYKNYRKDGTIRFFPIWLYAIPIVVATIIQTACYGISLMAPSFAVAIAGAFTSLQNERVFRDQLTGLFNRPFLDYVFNLYTKKYHMATGIMISLRHFSEINEKLGSKVGDQALCKATEILHDSVGHWGSILRYSGDEFVVMVDSQIDTHITNCIEKLEMNFAKFNREGNEPYKLIPVIGYKKRESKKETIDHFIDGLMAAVRKAKKDIP